MSINEAWHKEHRMPERATVEQRIEWHKEHEHAVACGCRPIPPKLLEEMKKRRLA